MGTSPKSICTYVEETISEPLPKETFDPCITFVYNIQMLGSLVRWNLLALANKKI